MNDRPQHRPPDGEHEAMRRLLDDAVSDVAPREALDQIRSRTKVSPMARKRPWILGAGAAAAAVAATVAAVAVVGGNPGTTTADPGPAGSAGTSGAPSPSAPQDPSESAEAERSPTETEEVDPPRGAQATIPVYFAGETSRGPRLYREFQKAAVTGDDTVTPALTAALEGAAQDPDYRSDWPAGTFVAGAHREGDVFLVQLGNMRTDLRNRPSELTEEEARIAVEQLIFTVQAALQDRVPVQFMIGSEIPERTDTLLGVPASEPLAEGEPAEVQAGVWVIDPSEGATVSSPFRVSGLANAFEANVVWELRQGDTVVKEGFTTAEECCRMAPYEFTVQAPPGDYTLVVHDTDVSGGEGFAPWQDTKSITVR